MIWIVNMWVVTKIINNEQNENYGSKGVDYGHNAYRMARKARGYRKKIASVCAFVVCLCYENIRKIKVNSAIPDWTLMWTYEFGSEISPGRLSLHALRCSWCHAVSFHLKYTILLSWFRVDALRPTFSSWLCQLPWCLRRSSMGCVVQPLAIRLLLFRFPSITW